MTDARVVLVTIDSMEKAEALAGEIVRRRLAACVNIVGDVMSVYEWEGKVCKDAERLMIIKTTESNVEALKEFTLAQHGYDVPEFIVLPIETGSEAYLEWIRASVEGPKPNP